MKSLSGISGIVFGIFQVMVYPKYYLSLLMLLVVSGTTTAQVPWDIDIIKPEMITDSSNFEADFFRLKAPNYQQLGSVTVNLPNGKRKSFKKLLHYNTMQVVDLNIPMDNFPERHMKVLNMKSRWNGELLHYNGKVSSVKFRRSVNYKNTANVLCQFDHQTGQWSELVLLDSADNTRYFHPFATDRNDTFMYYGTGYRVDNERRMGEPTRFDVKRLNLETREVEDMLTLNMPKREHYLHFDHTLISPNGKWLILTEYGDKAWRQNHPNDTEAVTYIIDTETNVIKTTRVPDTPYGRAFSPDSRYLFLGSYETGEVVKIDLETGERLNSTHGTRTIFGFFMAPSGNYFLIEYHEEKCPRKVIDIRRTSDLKLITSVLLDDLFPEPDLSRSLYSAMDGRIIFSRASSPKDNPKYPGRVLIHRLPESISKADPGSAIAKKLERAETIANGKLYAERNHIDLSPPHYDLGNTTAVTIASDENVIITGSHYIETMTSEPVIAKLDKNGEKIWEKRLPTEDGAISEAGLHIPTPDGGCVVYYMYYAHEKSFGQARIARINGDGKVLYDTYFEGRPNPNAYYMTKGMEYLPDGSVRLVGRFYPTADDHVPWTGILSPEGKLIQN